MSFLGIGPLEFVLLAILALVILGPKDIALAGKKLGRFLYKVKNSDIWKSIQETRQQAKDFGHEIMDDADLDDLRRELNSFGFQPNPINRGNVPVDGKLKLPKMVAPNNIRDSDFLGTTTGESNKII